MVTKKEIFQEKKNRSSYYRTSEESPIFPFKNSSLTAGSYELFDFETDNTITQKYLPFTSMQIINNSNEEIYIYINQGSNAKAIPSGTIITFERGIIPALRSVKIYNAGSGTIAENEVEISVWKEGVTVDQAFKKMHRAFFRFLYKY